MQMRRRELVSNIDSFDVAQTILLLGVAETFDRSSRSRNTQWRNPHWSIPVNEQIALWTEQVALPQND